MKKSIIIVTGIFTTIITACSNNNSNEKTDTQTQISTGSNPATAPVSTPMLPAFTVQDVNGKLINLQGLGGKKVFVNLWASWCPPCKREMPSIARLYKSVDTAKVAFVMISLDDRFEKAKSYIRSSKLELPVYYPAENLPPLFNVQGIPATFIFNEKGEMIKRVDGSDNYDSEEYRKLLNEL